MDGMDRKSLEQSVPTGPVQETATPETLSAEEQRGASASATQGVERPMEAQAPNPENLQEFSGPAPDAPAPDAPAPDAGKDGFKAIKPDGAYDLAIKAAIEAGKTLPAPADARGYTAAEALQMSKDNLIEMPEKDTLGDAFKKVGEKLPDGLNEQVKQVLSANPEFAELKNAQPVKDEAGKPVGFRDQKPAVSDAVKYANQIAVTTGNFEPEAIEASFRKAFNTETRGALIDLAKTEGIELYPEHKSSKTPEGRKPAPGQDENSPVKVDGLYDRAIKSAIAEGKALPAPADPEKGYTNAEAKQMTKDKAITLPENSRAAKTPDQGAEKPMASRDDARAVIDYLNAGHGADGKKGVSLEVYKSLGTKAQNELKAIVKALNENPEANVPVTTYLAKDFKEKVFEKEGQPA